MEADVVKNNWVLPRNKRQLTPVTEILSAFHLGALNEQWSGDLDRQLRLEEILEELGIKRAGRRRDQGGGGARTYETWLSCLGLIFEEENTGLQRLTIAGEMLLEGESPKLIITDQLMKFQYPSSYTLRQQVRIADRFRVHPFRFMLALLCSGTIDYLTQEEIALFVITEGDRDTDECINHVSKRIVDYRSYGNKVLPNDFCERYPSKTGIQNFNKTKLRLNDIANTFINFLEYTQLAARIVESSGGPKMLRIIKPDSVNEILSRPVEFIDQPDNKEYFQRRFGLAGGRRKDTRTFGLSSVSSHRIQERLVETCFLSLAAKHLVDVDDRTLIETIIDKTGCQPDIVTKVLADHRGREAGIFEAEYYKMSLSGRENATAFELATVELFGEKGFGFKAEHTGTTALRPDVYILSSPEGYSGIIDNKAYAAYSISNDHLNRMVHNYLPYYKNKDGNSLKFFMYIAGGFKTTFADKVAEIHSQSSIEGCGISASNIIKLLETYRNKKLKHHTLKNLFRLNREVNWLDITNLKETQNI